MAKEITFDDDAAFARPSTEHSTGDMGMTKREYFAACAMQGLCAAVDTTHIDEYTLYGLAKSAVDIADALMFRLNETLK